MSGFRFREYIPKNKYGEVIVSQEPPPPLLCHDDPDIKGSLAYDLQHGGYTLRWKNMEEVTSWRIQQEKSLSIELIHTAKRLPGDDMKHLWSEKHIYVCSRGPCRGKSNYVKKHNYQRKVPRKRIDCGCRLQFKIYPHTTEILGRYNDEHTHDTGRNNARFTRLRKETREEIERLLRLGVEPTNVLSQVQGDIYNESNIPNLNTGPVMRNEFCTRADVRRVEKKIEEELIRLASQDGESVLLWVTKLRAQGHFVTLKTARKAERRARGRGLLVVSSQCRG